MSKEPTDEIGDETDRVQDASHVLVTKAYTLLGDRLDLGLAALVEATGALAAIARRVPKDVLLGLVEASYDNAVESLREFDANEGRKGLN